MTCGWNPSVVHVFSVCNHPTRLFRKAHVGSSVPHQAIGKVGLGDWLVGLVLSFHCWGGESRVKLLPLERVVFFGLGEFFFP